MLFAMFVQVAFGGELFAALAAFQPTVFVVGREMFLQVHFVVGFMTNGTLLG